MSHGKQTRAAERLPTSSWLMAIGLAAVFSSSAIVEAVRLLSLRNPEIWGHLRVGAWILENKSVPRFGIFSQAATLAWRDVSWGYDAVAAIAYKVLGLRAIPALAMAFLFLMTAVLFLLAGGRQRRVLAPSGLALVGIYTLSVLGPSPSGVSVVLFGIEFLMLIHWRQADNPRVKVALPLLFLVWANVDIGFVYGMTMLALFTASAIASRMANPLGEGGDRKHLWRETGIVFVACLIVSGITPYGFACYPAFWGMENSGANLHIPGYGAMGFRQTVDYAVLMLGMAAFLALGLRRSRDVFLVLILAGSAALAFHSQRENWLLIVSSIGAIGAMFPAVAAKSTDASLDSIRWPVAVATGSLLLVGTTFFAVVPGDSARLMGRVAQAFPVKACDHIRSERLPQPLFNAYEWGAFVMWYLPEYPVAIDARRGLYSEEMETDYFKVMKVDVPYQSLQAMKDARTILLPKSNVLAGGLRDVPGFQVAYEDDVAIVLLHRAKE